MRVAIASDHAGFDQKDKLRRHLEAIGHEVVDMGTDSGDVSVDYPDFGAKVGRAVASGEVERGVLVCGTGIGIAIAANKIPGVRAANVTDPEFAKLARQHNDANVISVSGRLVPIRENEIIIDTFLDTPFEGGRHQGRVEKISALEQQQ